MSVALLKLCTNQWVTQNGFLPTTAARPVLSVDLRIQEMPIEILPLSCIGCIITGKLFVLSEPHMIAM